MTHRADDTHLILETLMASARRFQADCAMAFWTAATRRFGVTKVCFSAHLPDDQSAYVLEAIPWLGSPRTLIVPERWLRELAPLPSILDLTRPRTEPGEE
jgi:hypothetical protein